MNGIRSIHLPLKKGRSSHASGSGGDHLRRHSMIPPDRSRDPTLLVKGG